MKSLLCIPRLYFLDELQEEEEVCTKEAGTLEVFHLICLTQTAEASYQLIVVKRKRYSNEEADYCFKTDMKSHKNIVFNRNPDR